MKTDRLLRDSGAFRGLLAVTLVLLTCAVPRGHAGALRTRFTTVVLRDLPVGHATRLRLADGRRYSVENTSKRDLPLRFLVQKPNWVQPNKGGPAYQPIPATDWVTLEPATATAPAGGKAEVEVTIRAPEDAALIGRHFEFWLRAETTGESGGLALLTRVRFNITAKPDEDQLKRLKPESAAGTSE